MRPISRKPVGSGVATPPPGDFVIQPAPPVPPHDFTINPYHAVSEPPPERQSTTASAPRREWHPYDHQNYSNNWADSGELYDCNDSASHVHAQQSYGYSPSVISQPDVASQATWESSSSLGYDASNYDEAPPMPPAPSSPIHSQHQPEPEETPKAESVAPPDQAALGIGTGSDYIKRRRRAAGLTSTVTMPKVLPIGIKAAATSRQYSAPPAFVRKAMDIRYAHLPQRMLASEIDDEDNIPDSPVGRGSFDSSPSIGGRHAHSHSLTTVHTHSSLRRSTSSADSVVEDKGKIKLFVANPDD